VEGLERVFGSREMGIFYLKKCLAMYEHVFYWKIMRLFNRYFLKTYPLIEDCARCRDCGRNVHDFIVPDKLWLQVIGTPNGVWCYDCFCNRADEKLRVKWRMTKKSLDIEKEEWICLTEESSK